jgi:hypothetical protein
MNVPGSNGFRVRTPKKKAKAAEKVCSFDFVTSRQAERLIRYTGGKGRRKRGRRKTQIFEDQKA